MLVAVLVGLLMLYCSLVGLLEVVVGLDIDRLELLVIDLLQVVIGLLVVWVYFPGSIVIRSMSSPRNNSPFPNGSYLEINNKMLID